MSIFTRLRNALALADKVSELESRVNSIEMDWNDVLDKILAREERMRKRLKAQVQSAIEPDTATANPVGGKAAIRARITALRAQGG